MHDIDKDYHMLENTQRLKMPAHGWIGFVLLIVSEMLMLRGVEPFSSYFYSFAWWSYILLVDGIVYMRKGNSLLVNRRREFLTMVPWSVVFWLVIEAFNFQLKNWYYANMETFLPARWTGYFIAYATVLPALFETLELLESFDILSGVKGSRYRFSPTARWAMATMGTVMLLITLIAPRYAFPLVWLGFVFLLDPIVYRFGGRSLLRKMEEEGPVKLYRLMIAGIICGFLWEFWNFWARIKWYYTVPFFDEIKLFEMHVMGFLGFAPFAVECYVMYAFVCLFRDGRWWEHDSTCPSISTQVRHVGRTLLAAASMAIFFPAMFHALDNYTVDSYASRMGDFTAVSKEEERRINALNVDRVEDFDRWAKRIGARGVSQALGIPEEKAHRLQEIAQLAAIKGMGTSNFRLLELAGVDTTAKLARQEPDTLFHELLLINKKHRIRQRPPRRAILKNWILAAKDLSG